MNSPLSQNQWELKTTKNESSCFICSKFTTGCLVYKFGKLDWFFTCLTHLEDPGFAKLLPSLTTPQSSKVTEACSDNKVDDKEKTEGSDKDKDKDENKDKEEEKKEEPKPIPEPIPNQPKIYQLHRSILYLRENQLKLKKQQQKVKTTSAKLPSAPNHDLK